MRKKIRPVLLLVMIGMMTILAANCGGGGGGGTAPSTPSTNRTVTVSGNTNNDAPRMAGREDAAAVSANTTIVAYNPHTGALLSSGNDKIASNGSFNITVDLGTNSALDVVLEIYNKVQSKSSASDMKANLKYAFDNLSANSSGITVNYDSTRSATIFVFQPDQVLADIKKADTIMKDKGIDILDTVTTPALALEFMNSMAEAVKCGATDSQCITNALQASNDSLAASSPVKTMVETAGREYAVDSGWTKIQEIYNASGQTAADSITNINTADKQKEICWLLSDAIGAWDASYATSLEKFVAVKDVALAVKNGETFNSSDVKTAVTDLWSSLVMKIQHEAASGSAAISETDLGSVISGFDGIRGLLIRMFVTKAGATRADAAAAVDALLKDLAEFGVSSENTAAFTDKAGAEADDIMDRWVTTWATAAFAADLMTALSPVDMNDQTKTENLMRLAHDLAYLTNPTDAQVEDVLNDYLSTETTALAMTMYRDHKSCDVSSNTNCPSEEEILALLESHWAKPLPKLRAVIDGLEEWYNSPDSNIEKIGLGNSLLTMKNVYKNMKASSANKSAIGTVLSKAGVKKEIFWLLMNVEPYLPENVRSYLN